jgi:tetratricopeptide (TPR) repeat protein
MVKLFCLMAGLLGLAGAAQANMPGAAAPPNLHELELMARRSPWATALKHELVERYAAVGDPERAMYWARLVSRDEPGSGRSYNSLGLALAAAGESTQARAAFIKATRRSPKLVEAYLNRASVSMTLGEPRKAVDEYDMATVVDRKSVEGWLGLSRSLAQLGFLPNAREAASEAIKIQPRNPEGYIALGELYADQSRPVEARPPLGEAYRLGDRSAKLYSVMALAYGDQPRNAQDTDLAIHCGEQALRMGDRSSRLLFGLGLAYQRARRYPEAVQTFQTLLQNRSAAHGAWVCLSQCYHALGQTTRAHEAARTAQRIIGERQVVDRLKHQIQQAPHRLELREQLAAFGMKTGNYFMAADQFGYLANNTSHAARYWRKAAEAMRRAGALEQAEQAERHAREASRPEGSFPGGDA